MWLRTANTDLPRENFNQPTFYDEMSSCVANGRAVVVVDVDFIKAFGMACDFICG